MAFFGYHMPYFALSFLDHVVIKVLNLFRQRFLYRRYGLAITSIECVGLVEFNEFLCGIEDLEVGVEEAGVA